MGLAPEKASRIKRLRGFIPRRDQPPDPWSMWTMRLKNTSCQFDKHRPGIRTVAFLVAKILPD